MLVAATMSDSGFVLFLLLLGVGTYALNICWRDFCQARRSGDSKKYFYLLGVVFSFGLIFFTLIGGLLIWVGPLH